MGGSICSLESESFVVKLSFNQKSSQKKSKKRENSNLKNNKSLGQHWLRDRFILDGIAEEAKIKNGDFVLEIGPGLGTLTSSLLRYAGDAGEVLSIEFAENYQRNFQARISLFKMRIF